EAGVGLGESVVSGSITPDHYVVDKTSFEVKQKQVNKQEFMIVRSSSGTGNEKAAVPEELNGQKLSNGQIVELAKIGKKIEEHYGAPQDIEWAVENNRLFVVQSRAITTLGKTKSVQDAPVERSQATEQAAVSVDKAKILLQGMGASPGIASGRVSLIFDVKEIYKVKEGDVLVTEMTTPDFVPAMKRAAAIITDAGGATAHAAIVSRELGIPCIVGSRTATVELKGGQLITVDAKRGVVYDGVVDLGQNDEKEVQDAVTGGKGAVVTGTKIYVNVAEPGIAEKVAKKNVDGVGLLRAEFMVAGIGKHPRALIKQGKQEEFIASLAKGLRKACAAFYPKPIIYRATDFKSNEYKNLEGGEEFEPKEENPMIGFRGCFRYVKDAEVFNMELEAIKRVREKFGMKNLWLMIPFVRTVHEFEVCRELVGKSGLHHNRDFKLGIMCEVPSTVINAEEFCLAGAQFFSIGSNDLTQLTLGVDRDNPIVAEDFDERDPAILRSIKRVIEKCHKHGVKVGICGQAPSVYPEFAEALVEYGIDSISVNPDVIESTRRIVASAEKRVQLKKLRELSK
ncbi:MAG: phosphoenolpyruvate synthase, partial [Candidatus Micrarchaeia archaeon]